MNAEITLREGYILPIKEGQIVAWNAIEVEWHNTVMHTKSAEWAELKPSNRLHLEIEVWHGEEKLLRRRLLSSHAFNRFFQCIDLRPFQKKSGANSSFKVQARLLAYNDDGDYKDGEYLNGIEIARTSKMFIPWEFPAKLEKRIELKYFPGLDTEHSDLGNYFPRFGDVDNDGRYEVFFSQGTLGQMMYDLDGKMLWEYRDESGVYDDLRPDSDVAIYDIDGDGFAEVICVRKISGAIHICILDGRTGKVKRSVEWPKYYQRKEGGRRCGLRIANIRGLETPQDIVASQDYTHMTVFDDQLKMLWDLDPETHVQDPSNWFVNAHGYPYKFALGHSPIFKDIDDDGKDEILWGATLLDHDGRIIWSRNDLRMVGDYDDEHIDCPRFVDLHDDGDVKIYFSSGGYLLDIKGNVLLSLEKLGFKIIHGQRAAVEKICRDVAGKQILQMDFFGGRLLVFDSTGTLLWRKSIDRSFQVGDWTGTVEKAVFLADKKNSLTTIVDGDGRTLCTIPAKMYLWESLVTDICGDGRDEFITPLVTEDGRAFLDIYSCATPSLNPDDRNLDFRHNRPQLWNWTAF